MSQENIILKCKDVDGKIVIFHQSNYDKHKRKHPELEDNNFFPGRVKNALRSPTFTVPGFGNESTCFYFEEFAISGIIKYTKVVVMNQKFTVNNERVRHIMTAHKTDRIQETKYPELKLRYY